MVESEFNGGGTGVSYQEEVIAVTETVLSYRYITVPTGDPAPDPAEDYTITLILSDIAGKDIYLEHKTFEKEPS